MASQEAKKDSDKAEAVVDHRPLSIVHGPNAPLPLTMTFGELLEHHASTRGAMPAVISDPQNRIVSFTELHQRSDRLAAAMAHAGIGKGDLVSIAMGSRFEYFEVCNSRRCRQCDRLQRTKAHTMVTDLLRMRKARRCVDLAELRISRIRDDPSLEIDR